MECIHLLKQTGSFLVPTLITYDRIKRNGEACGMPLDQIAKVSVTPRCKFCTLETTKSGVSFISPKKLNKN